MLAELTTTQRIMRSANCPALDVRLKYGDEHVLATSFCRRNLCEMQHSSTPGMDSNANGGGAACSADLKPQQPGEEPRAPDRALSPREYTHMATNVTPRLRRAHAERYGGDEQHPSKVTSFLLHGFPVTRWWGRLRQFLCAPPQSKSGHAKPAACTTPYTPPLPSLYLRFDWMFHEAASWAHGRNPKTVWAQPTLADNGTARSKDTKQVQLANLHQKLVSLKVPREGKQRILVCAGEDTHLSIVWASPSFQAVLPWFSRIFFEAMDVHVPRVFPMPIALQESYVRRHQYEALLAATEAEPRKTGDVIAAWGSWWPKLTDEIASRVELRSLCRKRAPWLNCCTVPPERWWSTMPRFRFMLNPTGRGVQSPKCRCTHNMSPSPALAAAPRRVEG